METNQLVAHVETQLTDFKKLPTECQQWLTRMEDVARLPYLAEQHLFSKLPDNDFQPDTDTHVGLQALGLLLRDMGRQHEALSFFRRFYARIPRTALDGRRNNKGMPLVWMSDIFYALGYHGFAKRYLMRTLVEDAIRSSGTLSPTDAGSYHRCAFRHGFDDAKLQELAGAAHSIAMKKGIEEVCADEVLEEMLVEPKNGAADKPPTVYRDVEWRESFVAPELSIWDADKEFVAALTGSQDKTGKQLERLACYLLGCVPGFQTVHRVGTPSTDYDVLVAQLAGAQDFRAEIGRYFVAECKDWTNPAGFSEFAKFCRVLDSAKCKFGVMFAPKGISGRGKYRFAHREQMKVFQDRGIVIAVIDSSDIAAVIKGVSFIERLKTRYEEVRMDLFHAVEMDAEVEAGPETKVEAAAPVAPQLKSK